MESIDEIKNELKQAIEWPLKHPQAFVDMGIRPTKGLLLFGPSGTGKTLLAKAIASETEVNFISILAYPNNMITLITKASNNLTQIIPTTNPLFNLLQDTIPGMDGLPTAYVLMKIKKDRMLSTSLNSEDRLCFTGTLMISPFFLYMNTIVSPIFG